MEQYPDLLTVGETMILFDPVEQGTFRNVTSFRKRIGGAESNVAIGASRLGHRVGWISKVSDDELGDFIINSIRGEGVDTSRVIRTSNALSGVFIKERVRKDETHVYYYRANSAASLLSSQDIDWEYIKHAKMIHVTGITPFLSVSCQNILIELLETCKKNKQFISFDPNLRMKLMENIRSPKELLLEMIKGVDLFMPGMEEADYLFGTTNSEKIFDICESLGVKKVVLKNGEHGSYFMDNGTSGFIESVEVEQVLDPIGAGDGFASGVLTALLEGLTLEQAVQRGSIVGAMVVTTEGDIEGLPTKRRLEQFSSTNQDVIR